MKPYILEFSSPLSQAPSGRAGNVASHDCVGVSGLALARRGRSVWPPPESQHPLFALSRPDCYFK